MGGEAFSSLHYLRLLIDIRWWVPSKHKPSQDVGNGICGAHSWSLPPLKSVPADANTKAIWRSAGLWKHHMSVCGCFFFTFSSRAPPPSQDSTENSPKNQCDLPPTSDLKEVTSTNVKYSGCVLHIWRSLIFSAAFEEPLEHETLAVCWWCTQYWVNRTQQMKQYFKATLKPRCEVFIGIHQQVIS